MFARIWMLHDKRIIFACQCYIENSLTFQSKQELSWSVGLIKNIDPYVEPRKRLCIYFGFLL